MIRARAASPGERPAGGVFFRLAANQALILMRPGQIDSLAIPVRLRAI